MLAIHGGFRPSNDYVLQFQRIRTHNGKVLERKQEKRVVFFFTATLPISSPKLTLQLVVILVIRGVLGAQATGGMPIKSSSLGWAAGPADSAVTVAAAAGR